MAPRQIKVHGLKDIEKVLRQLPLKARQRVVMNGLRAGARLIAKDAKARVPVRTGALRDSITVATVRKSKRSARRQVLIGFKKPVSRRAHLTEFGTKFQPAEPFMRPALDSQGPAAIVKMGKIWGRGIEREASLLARPGLLLSKQRKRFF